MTPLLSSRISCPACGHKNRGDARFCANCGESLPENDAPKTEGHRWAKGPNDFAVRIEADDLPGMLRRGLIVEPGTNALIVDRGEVQGTVPPGAYTLEKAGAKAWDWLTTGISDQATALLVDVTPTDLDFHLGGRFTADPLPIGVTIRLRASVKEPGRFLLHVLKGRERMSLNELREYLYPEVIQVTDEWLRRHTLETLVNEPKKRDELELAIEDALDRVFKQSGLTFDHIRTVELNLEPYDEIKGIRGEKQLLIYRSEAELGLEATQTEIEIKRKQAQLETKHRFDDIQHEFDLQALVEKTRQVEQEERKIELYARMRDATLSNRMDQVRTDREFEAFLNQIDTEKLLEEKERKDLLKTWAEEEEDHDRARAHLLAKLDVEQDFERRLIALRLQSDLDMKQLESEMDLLRTRADKQEEIEYARWSFELKKRREQMAIDKETKVQELEIADMEREAERLAKNKEAEDKLNNLRAKLELARESLQSMKELRMQEARHKWALEKERLELELTHKEKEAEMAMAHERLKSELELDRLDKISKLGVEALISISPDSQAKIIADLKKTEAMQGLSEDQILVLAAKDSPTVAQALAEKFKAIAAGEANEETKALYERLLVEKQASLDALQIEADKRVLETRLAWEKASAQTKEIAEKGLDSTSDIAKAFAHGPDNPPTSPTVILPGPGGPQVIQSGGSGAGMSYQTKICPNCGRNVPVESRHCEHCGKKFEGMG